MKQSHKQIDDTLYIRQIVYFYATLSNFIQIASHINFDLYAKFYFKLLTLLLLSLWN